MRCEQTSVISREILNVALVAIAIIVVVVGGWPPCVRELFNRCVYRSGREPNKKKKTLYGMPKKCSHIRYTLNAIRIVSGLHM